MARKASPPTPREEARRARRKEARERHEAWRAAQPTKMDWWARERERIDTARRKKETERAERWLREQEREYQRDKARREALRRRAAAVRAASDARALAVAEEDAHALGMPLDAYLDDLRDARTRLVNLLSLYIAMRSAPGRIFALHAPTAAAVYLLHGALPEPMRQDLEGLFGTEADMRWGMTQGLRKPRGLQ